MVSFGRRTFVESHRDAISDRFDDAASPTKKNKINGQNQVRNVELNQKCWIVELARQNYLPILIQDCRRRRKIASWFIVVDYDVVFLPKKIAYTRSDWSQTMLFASNRNREVGQSRMHKTFHPEPCISRAAMAREILSLSQLAEIKKEE